MESNAAADAIQGLSLPARMEAILYLKGRPLSLAELAEIAAISREEAELGLITLITDYAHRDTALEVRQEGNRYSLQLRDGLGDLVQNLLPVDLSTASIASPNSAIGWPIHAWPTSSLGCRPAAATTSSN